MNAYGAVAHDGADAAIFLDGITKRFGDAVAVDAFDITVPRGTLCGFIGPNGAGKTTTIRMIMSIFFPDSGRLSVLGRASALDAKDRIGYLPEERGVYRRMRVGDFLSYVGRLKGLRGAGLGARVQRHLERIGLGDIERKRCEELSKGMLQKVQFVAATIHEPELIILDEPFSGLDPVSMRLLRDLVVEEHRRGATVLFSTHVMPQAEELCEHVVMIHRGRKVLDDEMPAIRRRYDPRTILFEPYDPAADAAPLRALAGVAHVERGEEGFLVTVAEGTAPVEAMQRIASAVAPARMELARPRLEDIFVEIVAGGTEDESAIRREAGLEETAGEASPA